MFNKTSVNKIVTCKILAACRATLSNESGVSYVANKKGNNFLRVKRVVSKAGKIGFEVLGKDNKNVGQAISHALISDRKAQLFAGHDSPRGIVNFIMDRILYSHEIKHSA